MNCEKCQELISDYIDGTLTSQNQTLLSRHLEDCLSCVEVCEEMQAIVSVAHDAREQFIAPPNERAMWLRIRNAIEGELSAKQLNNAVRGNLVHSSLGESFWSRVLGKRWELSLPQMVTAVSAIVVAVSLATVLGVQGFTNTQRVEVVANSSNEDNLPRNDANFASSPRRYVREVDIDYWKQRVEQRKGNWNPRMRDAFNRSMGAIDLAVSESLSELNRNPHDEISEEMLNAALRDKIEMLQEFSEY